MDGWKTGALPLPARLAVDAHSLPGNCSRVNVPSQVVLFRDNGLSKRISAIAVYVTNEFVVGAELLVPNESLQAVCRRGHNAPFVNLEPRVSSSLSIRAKFVIKLLDANTIKPHNGVNRKCYYLIHNPSNYLREREEMKEFVLHVRHLPDFKNAETVVRSIDVREFDGVKCFIPIGDGFETKRLPNDFYLREFMALNPDDYDQLLEFQNEWGLIKSFMGENDDPALRMMNLANGLTNQPRRDEYTAAKKTQKIRNSTSIYEAGRGWLFESEETIEQMSAVSLDESSACVANMQVYIKALVDAAENGVIEDENHPTWHYVNSRDGVRYISSYVDMWFPTISLTTEADAHMGNNVPIMAMIAAQCLYGLQTKERGEYTFKTCLQCGEVFQFGRKGEEGDSLYKPRPAASPYCSPQCQKNYSRHKKDENGKWLY